MRCGGKAYDSIQKPGWQRRGQANVFKNKHLVRVWTPVSFREQEQGGEEVK